MAVLRRLHIGVVKQVYDLHCTTGKNGEMFLTLLLFNEHGLYVQLPKRHVEKTCTVNNGKIAAKMCVKCHSLKHLLRREFRGDYQDSIEVMAKQSPDYTNMNSIFVS